MNYVLFMAISQTLNAVDSRVYCQDSHASSWQPVGFSCPVVCQNIINAIERLKIMDFNNMIYQKQLHVERPAKSVQELSNENELNEIDIDIYGKDNTDYINERRKNRDDSKYRLNNDATNKTNANLTIDENNFYKDVLKLTQLAAKTFDGCNRSKKVGLIAMMKCARKSNIDGSFLKIMTKLLNKYAHSMYQFTEDMTEVLLQSLLGETTDLNRNVFDVDTLLRHLRHALHAHRGHARSDVIALGSKRCFALSLPGCFCKPGYVELSGQCVRPSDCIKEQSYAEYLPRVFIN